MGPSAESADVSPSQSTCVGVSVCGLRSAPASDDRVSWLRGRVETLVTTGHGDELALTWPPDTPTLRAAREREIVLTDLYVDAVARACSDVEQAHGLAFHDGDPLFAAFDQNPEVTLEQAATEARIPQPTATEWAERARTLLAPLEDENVQQAVATCAGAVAQKMTRRLHDNIAAVVAELLATQDGGPDGAVVAVCDDQGNWSITPSTTARDRLVAVHGNEIAALAAAKSHAKALGLPAPRSLKSVVEQPLLAALVAAGQQQ